MVMLGGIISAFISNRCTGFKGVEFGPDVTASCSKEDLVSAKERAGVEVVSLVGQNGELKRVTQLASIIEKVGRVSVADPGSL